MLFPGASGFEIEHLSELLTKLICPCFKLWMTAGEKSCPLLVCLVSHKPCFMFSLKRPSSCSHLVPWDCPQQGFRSQVKIRHLTHVVCSRRGRGVSEVHRGDLRWRPQCTGIEARAPHPPQMLASPEGPQSLGIPEVRKIPNPCHGLCPPCKVCCCYILAVLTAGIFRVVPFVIINCLWSIRLWVDAVYRLPWTNQPAPQRNTLALPSPCVFPAKQQNMTVCLGGKERRMDVIQFRDRKKYPSRGQT